MADKIQSIKGVHDVRPPEIHLWHRLEEAARRIFPTYGYDEIRTPIIEKTDLFSRSIGTETDVVSKEMYTFLDRADQEGKQDSITLRPEGTAGVVRAFIEHGLAQTVPSSRFWYQGAMFRRERPQKGRQRQFFQIGAEAFGQESPRVDAEVLVMLRDYLDDVGIRGVVFEVSSLGDEQCRPVYKRELQAFLRGVSDALCEDCKRRIETNPLRVLDCKKEGCRAATAPAPLLLDRVCDPCKEHFAEVRRNLDIAGVAYELNPRIVRGLDYYVRTSFELIHHPAGESGEALGSQNAVGGGGRYDGLVKVLGGPPVAGVGFALGVERLVLVLQAQQTEAQAPATVWIAAPGAKAQDAAMKLARELRAKGLRIEIGYDAKANDLRKQLERADKKRAKVAIIIGDAELDKNMALVRDLATRTQIEERLDAGALAAAVSRIS